MSTYLEYDFSDPDDGQGIAILKGALKAILSQNINENTPNSFIVYTHVGKKIAVGYDPLINDISAISAETFHDIDDGTYLCIDIEENTSGDDAS